jgi:class 3 adenylate cyclase/tetratricopeptide (TPR) repeat protein
MKCPKCQTENKTEAKFCKKCRTTLELRCPSCSAACDPDSAFCDKCGQPLTEPQPPPALDYTNPISYTPKHLAEKILAARTSMEGERKQVTVLFADVKGFTPMSEKLDPEEVQTLISECLVFFTEEVHRYEGAIAQFLGDGVMALFGAPIAHEDSPQRALYAALAIQQRLRDYAEKMKKDGIEFKMRIGLNTGVVVVGRIGDDLTMEYTAMGDTVNLASRMESTAEAGSIQVSENTYRLTEGYFEFKPLGEIEVKGKKEPVKAYELLSLGLAKTRLGVSVARGLTPFVGRQREIEHLKDCYARVKEGQGQVVGIVGEPGVGKSRLVLEFTKTLLEGEYTYLGGDCLHYGVSMAYLPFLDILRAYFNVKEGEREFIVKTKMVKQIASLDEKLKEILPPLHDILSLKVEDEAYLNLEPKQRREQNFEAIRTLLVRESRNKPLVIAIDDLQWIDKTSEEFLTYLIGGLASTHILLILLYRPEYAHPWANKTYYSQIRVDQLSSGVSSDLIRAILEDGEVAPELRTLILNRAAGNPLFMEEFTHSLVENGSIRKKENQYVLGRKASEIQVPDTIQGIIAARIDRLEDSLKRTMQVASVIGRDFAYRILQTIMGMQQELKLSLLNLEQLEFIYEKSLFPELEYMFKHALTQEVAYNSLLLKRRKEIHESIGQAIENLYSERLEEFCEVLAHHFARSENWEKAYQYLKSSGEKATRSYSLWEAFGFYKQAINTLSKLPDTEQNKRRGIETRLQMADLMMALGYPEDSFEILQQGEKLSRELDDARSLSSFHGSMGLYHAMKGDNPKAREYLEEAFAEAEKTQDVELVAPIGFQLCSTYQISYENLKIAEVAPRVIALLEGTQRKSGAFGPQFNLYPALVAAYGYALAILGDFREGQAQCEKALRFATEINDIGSMGYVEYWYGFLLTWKGEGKNAIEHLQNAVKYCEQAQVVTLLGLAWNLLGQAHALLGDYETALKYIEKGLRIDSDLGVSYSMPAHYGNLSFVYYKLGDLDNTLSYFGKLLELAPKQDSKYLKAQFTVELGAGLGKLDKSQFAQAEEYIIQGMKILEELKTRPDCARAYYALGELYADSGQNEKALEYLEKARDMFQEMGMDYFLRQTQGLLETLEAR